MGLSYVLPIRRRAGDAADELTDYLAWLGAKADVVVVDNSEDDAF
ncbi:MAG: hypothetical protein JWP02_2949, partial [Acidimicrobiales bacterium]|nr:hypothetical protein [Acidimicrobiales bacterium]